MKRVPSPIERAYKRSKRLLYLEDRQLYATRAQTLEQSLLHHRTAGVVERKAGERELIVSLTTYGRRLESVWLAIESIMRQTRKPHRIILWLDEVIADRPLPAALEMQKERGLEVRFTPDIGPYKKILPALKAFPEADVITIDDDLIYDINLIDRLVRASLRFPKCVVASWAMEMKSDSKYGEAVDSQDYDNPRFDLLPMGGSGTLYPSRSFDEEVHNLDAIKALCPTADDIWLRAMTLKKGVKCVRVLSPDLIGKDYVENIDAQGDALWHTNVINGANDRQLSNVMARYSLSFFK